MNETSEQITKRRAMIPRSYRANYDKAVSGNSLRAAVNAQCLECVCWKIKEIQNCPSVACPLYAVRPYQDLPQNTHQDQVTLTESPNLVKADVCVGNTF